MISRVVPPGVFEPVVGRDSTPVSATDALREEPSLQAGRIADATLTTWRDIAARLTPVIGHRGMAALFKRSLHLACSQYPWLDGVHNSALAPADFGGLRKVLAEQSAPAAAAASDALLQNFLQLLASLIGPALTERLAGSAKLPPTGAAAMQGTERDDA